MAGGGVAQQNTLPIPWDAAQIKDEIHAIEVIMPRLRDRAPSFFQLRAIDPLSFAPYRFQVLMIDAFREAAVPCDLRPFHSPQRVENGGYSSHRADFHTSVAPRVAGRRE